MIKIGITQGDINGVSYELLLKTFESDEILSLFTPVVYGSPKVATYYKKAIESNVAFRIVNTAEEAKDGALNMINLFNDEEQKIECGKATAEAGKAALTALSAALADLKAGNIDAMITLPMNDDAVALEDGSAFAGQKAYIDNTIGEGRRSLNILIDNYLRVAFVTDNMPVGNVKDNITRESVAERLIVLHNTLKRDFFIDNPRIAVLALNPHINPEDSTSAESQIITPVIDELFKRGVRCFGPYEAEKHFAAADYKHFDATLAMYHDQGMTAFRLLSVDGGHVYSAGLPQIVTSTVNGTEYAIAGKNQADETSLRQAIYTAIDAVRHRRQFDEERTNPLKKQYFDRRDDSDKLKLDQE